MASPTAVKASGKSAPRPPRPQARNDQQRLFYAVFDGDLASVQRLVRTAGVDLNAPFDGSSSRSLIDVAAMGAQAEIARVLIAHGAQVRGPAGAMDIRPIGVALSNLSTTMHLHGNTAAFVRMPERSAKSFQATIRVLLEAGADADGVLDPTRPQTALDQLLMTPRFDGDMDIARLLIDHGAQLGAAAPGGSPLQIAIRRGRLDFIDVALSGRHLAAPELDPAVASAVAMHDMHSAGKLLDSGAKPNANDGRQPLLCGSLAGDDPSHEFARLLLNHWARASIDCAGGPPLNRVMADDDLVLLMQQQGADPSPLDRNGATALDLVSGDDHDMIDTLMAHGAKLCQTVSDGILNELLREGKAGPTVRAILRREDYLATRLLQRDSLTGDIPCVAVLTAAAFGASSTLAELLHRGGDADSVTDGGISALMAAAYHGEYESLRVLLGQPKLDVDGATPVHFNPGSSTSFSEDPPPAVTGHRTALMYAAATNNAEAVRLLLERGANPRERDAEGLAVVDCARSDEIRRMLQSGRH